MDVSCDVLSRFETQSTDAADVVELPQSPVDDLISARAVHGRRMSLSQLVQECSHD